MDDDTFDDSAVTASKLPYFKPLFLAMIVRSPSRAYFISMRSSVFRTPLYVLSGDRTRSRVRLRSAPVGAEQASTGRLAPPSRAFFYAAKTFILRVSAIFVSKEDCRLCRLITEDRRIETWFYTLIFIFYAFQNIYESIGVPLL